MDVFDLRSSLVNDYAEYTKSFIKIADPRISQTVENELQQGAFWPQPLLQLNPTFKPGGTIDDLVKDKTLHPECSKIFKRDKDKDPAGFPLQLHTHQQEAILKAKQNRSYVLTSGTGSGKSLTYIIPIVDHILRHGSGQGIKAIVVYPMNALANSQNDELGKFLVHGYAKGESPVRFARYTGQEQGEERENIRANPPDILLTNYMMLELMLTRAEDRDLVRAAQGLKFLVFDELHTYRGRQGADVALLIRRCLQTFGGDDTICIGTSATMASGGTSEEQKLDVANVAQTLFGVAFSVDQIIGETLQRATPEQEFSAGETLQQLTDSITTGGAPPKDPEAFLNHPLASWIESTFGIQAEPETGLLIRQTPRRLEGPGSAAEDLAELTETDAEQCAATLRSFLTRGASLKLDETSRYPIFAFRLHQFFTRGDTVWSTIEPEAVRHLEISKKVSKPQEPEKLLYPLVFCRQCGAAYYRVKIIKNQQGSVLLPREDRRELNDDVSTEAYLYLSEDHPWPRTDGLELLERLPDSMKEPAPGGGERVAANSRKYVPEPAFVNASGHLVSADQGLPATLIHDNFHFCLHPECGVTYAANQRSERLKLGTLGVDNRSTATTILAVRSLIELQADRDLEKSARKLLSFTDNRQDASLQSGHFNDFAQVALLRSALHKATQEAGPSGLGHGQLSGRVATAMQLPFAEYAADSTLRGPARNSTHDALRRVVDYFLYRDLQRGWRVTAPNLEDCGLLAFDYEGLTGAESLIEDNELWSHGFDVQIRRNQTEFVAVPGSLSACPPEKREVILRTLLEVMRRSLAVKVDVLDGQKQMDLVEQTKHRLREDTVWYLEDTRDLERARVAYTRTRERRDSSAIALTSYTGFGRYLKRSLKPYLEDGEKFGREQVDETIRFLLLALKVYGIVEKVRDNQEENDPGYQINAAALRWLPGEGKDRPVDRTRMLDAGEFVPEVNQYFVECYRHFIDLKCLLEAREHTAQVSSEDRQDRELAFREGDLPLLFCSPTMELGVDIAQLNLVNLRNVPPTPANYAQRSGRAGRGGQPALVFTYCAGRSPHDQYYYREPKKMVAGTVAPPRIDIRNRDLLRSHIHAIWMEVCKPDLGKTLTHVVDLTPEGSRLPLRLKESITEKLADSQNRVNALTKADRLIDSIRDELNGATWFHDNWIREVLDRLELSFNAACDRWRDLYRSAVRQRELHHQIVGDHNRTENERNHSRRLRAQAESQIKLLTEAKGVYEGDFYSYRYFAAEGFLPGYNFPRLPLSAYVPGRRRRKGRDEFISRPRFLAISEFGPRALVYHEGARYRVNKVNIDFDSENMEDTHSLPTATMKRCPSCGYAHLEKEDAMAEVCDRCGCALDDPSRIDGLVHLQNVSLKLAQRITCDEEERQRFGYRMITSYRFPEVGGQLDRRDAEVVRDDKRLMRLSYGDATDLYRINQGWANQTNSPDGFVLDLERGYWASNRADEQDRDDATTEGRTQRVVPYVRDTKNALVMRLDPVRPPSEMASLQASFKEAIQKYFQLEPRELSCEPIPSLQERNEILFFEASEGGAGVLRQIVEDPDVLPLLAEQALEVCHFDPETLEDRGTATCGNACYECLLDYGNQRDHTELDRYAIRDQLKELSQAQCRPAGGMGSREERMVELRKRCDSKLESRWLDRVDALLLRPPSDAQFLIESCSTRPDFYYREYNAAIYIDGPPHDQADQIRKDEEISECLSDRGYIVIRFYYKDDWDAVFRRHPDVFGKPNQ